VVRRRLPSSFLLAASDTELDLAAAAASSSSSMPQSPASDLPASQAASSTTTTTTLASPIRAFANPLEYLLALEENEGEGEEGELLVVLYAASYCKICQRVGITYRQIASRHLEDRRRLLQQQQQQQVGLDTGGGGIDNGSSSVPMKLVKFARLEIKGGGSKGYGGDRIDLDRDDNEGQKTEPSAKGGLELTVDALRALGLTKFPFVQIFYGGDCVASFSTGPSHLFRQRVQGTLDVCLNRSEEEWTALRQYFADDIRKNRAARHDLLRAIQQQQQQQQQQRR